MIRVIFNAIINCSLLYWLTIVRALISFIFRIVLMWMAFWIKSKSHIVVTTGIVRFTVRRSPNIGVTFSHTFLWRSLCTCSGWRGLLTVVHLDTALTWLAIRHRENPADAISLPRRCQTIRRANWRTEGKINMIMIDHREIVSFKEDKWQ